MTPDQERIITSLWSAKTPFELGAIAERERIIELLGDKLRTVQVKGYPEWTWQTNAQIIALIEGGK